MIDLLREEVDVLFESHDKDQNGKLSWQEFSGQESKNEKAFKLMDADHNGKITKSVSLIILVFGRSKCQINSIPYVHLFKIFFGQHGQNTLIKM